MSAGHHSATGAGLQLLHPASALGRASWLQGFAPVETFEAAMKIATLGLLSLVQAFPQLGPHVCPCREQAAAREGAAGAISAAWPWRDLQGDSKQFTEWRN